ncbi:MAG: PAC2 family protein [Dehalococcoidia bacterium]
MNGQDLLIFDSKPVLKSPYFICGLSGWVNGGEVSVTGINHFIKQFNGVKFAEMPASRFHIYQIPGLESLRPVFRMEDGLIEETHMPTNRFYFAKNPGSEHDLIFFLGTEPSLNWEEYADTVVSLADEFGAARLYASCGILDRSPYTREPIISCTCTGAAIKEEMEKYNVTFSHREGPATFNQMLIYAAQKKGLEGVNFTVRVPFYPEHNILIGYSPKSTKAILVRLKSLMHLDMDFDELDEAIREVEEKLDSFRQQNPEFNTYIEELEKHYTEMPYTDSLDISPDDAIRLAEEFLKDNNNED